MASWKLDRTTDIQPKYFEVRRLELMYKSLFYFLRVFQDEAYKLLLEITGSASGPSSSMTKIFKSELNSVTQRLKSDFPDYFEWFEDLRERRNKIKAYGDFDSNFKSDDIEIRFKVIAGNDKELNERNLDLNVPDVNFGEYFEDAILKCIKLNKLIFDMYIEQRNKNET